MICSEGCVAAAFGKVRRIHDAVDIGSHRMPKIGIEVDQTGTVHEEIQIFLQTSSDFGMNPKSRLSNISLHDFHAV